MNEMQTKVVCGSTQCD